MKKIIICAFLCMGIISNTVFASIAPSSWAAAEVAEAESLSLVPSFFTNTLKDYTKSITREEFCAIAVAVYETIAKKDVPVPNYHPFSDTISKDVEKAYNAGLVNGKSTSATGEKLFLPEDTISRQEIAKILYEIATSYNSAINSNKFSQNTITFNDRDKIGNWALPAVTFMTEHAIIKGRDDGTFDPLASCTVQEGIILSKRLYDKCIAASTSSTPEPTSTASPKPASTSSPGPHSTADPLKKEIIKNEEYNYFDFTTEEEALEYMTEITIPIWKLASNGEKVASTTKITVHKYVQEEFQAIFEEIFNGEEKFPIKTIGAYAWRAPMASGRLSEHNLGTAVDINWEENYALYPNGSTVGNYWKPGEDPYSIPQGGDVENAFRRYGWGWGGFDWGANSPKDYMHFSYFRT